MESITEMYAVRTPIDPDSFHGLDISRKFHRISAKTFCEVFNNHPNFERVLVVDCRSSAEYDAGHIKTAIRCHPTENNTNIPDLYRREYDPNTLFIFHCEFSGYRGPDAINLFIGEHEKAGREREELHGFVLDGGFCDFYEAHKDFCEGYYLRELECPNGAR
jgi:rhodanese-related sulfurtransferase